MGVFNFFIVIPEITAALLFGPLIRLLFGTDNPNAPLYMVMFGGIFLLGAAALMGLVHDVATRPVPEEAVIAADESELLLVQESAQPVPSSGLEDGN